MPDIMFSVRYIGKQKPKGSAKPMDLVVEEHENWFIYDGLEWKPADYLSEKIEFPLEERKEGVLYSWSVVQAFLSEQDGFKTPIERKII
jgi:hypothetical protein